MKNKNVLMLVYSHYPSDTRVRKEALTLNKNGFKVDIVCLRKEGQKKTEIFEGIKVYRINLSKQRKGLFSYLFLYLSFFFLSAIKVNALFIKEKYAYIHIHNMPNFLVFTSIIPKLFGSKIILDMHDPMPELLGSVLSSENQYLKKLLTIEEKISISFVDKVITTNIAFKELFISRGCPEQKITIIMNSPYPEIFDKVQTKIRKDNNFFILYNGSIVKRHGLDLLIDAINLLVYKIPNIRLKIYGDGEFLNEIIRKIKDLNLENYITYCGAVLVDDILAEITECDLGVIPNRFNEFTNLNFPIRVFEFIHFKKPVIVPRTKGIQDYFSEDSIFYFEPDNIENLANLIYSIYTKKLEVEKLIEKSFNIYKKNIWDIQAKNLIKVYNENHI
ncbi:MAG: glycosyl transferase family 1 [Candidatus Woesearchaeota archaeon]|nr:MAG: glycosyl transferase family 1 [Candidatus Woesearchaeota archaeon]